MGQARPTPAFIRRAIEGVQAAGHQPAGVEVRQDGSVVVLIVAKEAAAALRSPANAAGGLLDCDAILAGVKGSSG